MLPSNWPRWITVPIGFALAVVSIGLGLILVVSVQAFASYPEPTPTPPRLAYAAPLSTECTACHTDKEMLKGTAATAEEVQLLYIEASQTESLHGRLGCVTCHQGTPGTQDITAAHTGVVADPSVNFQEDCLLCHSDLPDEFPEDDLLAPHQQVVQGLVEDLTCSDCHGAVGHGDGLVSGGVTISMTACIDCHKERNLDVGCDVCHTEMAAWSPDTDCGLCHMDYVESMKDASLLAYAHAQKGLECLDCHTDLEALAEAHVGAVPGAPVPALKVDMQFCFDCHVPNQHTSYDQVIQLTADYVIDDQQINPHDPHAGLEPDGYGGYDLGPYGCRYCHKMHEESPLINGCYGCHHEGTFQSCSSSGCHEQ
jgi:nitrate/TMAO reductase-like tetraheme cytochrome c subunit